VVLQALGPDLDADRFQPAGGSRLTSRGLLGVVQFFFFFFFFFLFSRSRQGPGPRHPARVGSYFNFFSFPKWDYGLVVAASRNPGKMGPAGVSWFLAYDFFSFFFNFSFIYYSYVKP
jgi:hypothetical protein